MPTPDLPRSSRQRLVDHVQELERFEEEKAEASAALAEAFKKAKGQGFDPATLRVILKLRKLTPAERKQRRALEAIYLASLGLLDGDPLPEEARRRLDGRKDQPKQDSGDTAAAGGDTPPSSATPADQGREAAGAGKRIFDNPYPAGDPCRAAWDEGWCESSGSNGMDTPSAFQRRQEKPAAPADPKSKPDEGQEGDGDLDKGKAA